MALNSFSPNTKIESAKVNSNFTNLSDNSRWVTMVWSFAGAVVAGQTAKVYFSLPGDITLERADVICDTAPTGQDLIADIERSTDGGSTWVTIFTTTGNRPTVSAGSRTGNTSTIDVDTGTANTHYYRAVLDQVGSTVAGADVTVSLKGKFNLD